MRFRRRIKIAPGVHLNVGKSSVGVRVGGRGYGISTNTKTGTRASVGLPGTGISYSTKVGGKGRRGTTQAQTIGPGTSLGCLGFAALGVIVFRSPFMWVIAAAALAIVIYPIVSRAMQRRAVARQTQEQTTRARLHLDLSTDPMFTQYRTRLEALASSGLRMELLFDHQVTAKAESSRRLPATMTLLSAAHPSSGRYEVTDPKYLLLQQNPYEIVLAAGVLIISPSPLEQAHVYRWSDLSTRSETIFLRTLSNRIPAGARIRGESYMYVRADGQPDRRYADNPRVSIVEYTDVMLSSGSTMVLRARFVDPDEAAVFSSTLTWTQPKSAGASTRERQPYSGPTRQHPQGTGSKSPYDVLGVPAGSDAATVRAAYTKLAQQYHPDKVSHLAPEFRELAETRMREINAAYEHLRDA